MNNSTAMKHAIAHKHLTDVNQSSWQLAAIQLAGVISIPSLASSILMIQKYSFYSSLITVIIGNSILWIIRFVLVKISFDKRKSTLDITYDCFGKIGAYIISFALLVGALVWFFIHTSVASEILVSFSNFNNFSGTNHFIQLSIIIGVLSTLLCMEGMKALRILALISLPILLLTFLGTLLFSSLSIEPVKQPFVGGFSLAGIGLVLGSNLGFSVDLPTFFRHRRSWKDSVNALTLFQLASLLIGIGGLFLAQIIHIDAENSDYTVGVLSTPQKYLLSVFLLISAVYANVYNVYSSSVGWEVLAPTALVGRKEYMILGLALTIFFISFYKVFSLHNLLDIADTAMINLCIVLFCFFLTRLLMRKPSTTKEKYLYLFAWVVSLMLNSFQVLYYGFISDYVLLTSVVTITCFVFINLLTEVGKKYF